MGPVDIKVLYSMVNGLWGMVVDHFEPFCLHHLRTIRYIPVSSKGPEFQPDLKYPPAAETENSGGK